MYMYSSSFFIIFKLLIIYIIFNIPGCGQFTIDLIPANDVKSIPLSIIAEPVQYLMQLSGLSSQEEKQKPGTYMITVID